MEYLMVVVPIIQGILPSNKKKKQLFLFFVLLFLIVCGYLCKQKKDSYGNALSYGISSEESP